MLRTMCRHDDGAARLGEVALVDRDSRIGRLETVFFDTLLDENAASHIALGQALDFAVDDPADRERTNSSELHTDFMIGSDEVAVNGVLAGRHRGAAAARRGLADLMSPPSTADSGIPAR